MRLAVAGVACFAAGAAAQPALRVDATVTQIAGQTAYVDVGAAAGLTPGDTLEVYRGESPAGRLVVLSVADDRAVLAFAGAPFPLTRGAHLALARVSAGRAAAPPAGEEAPRPAEAGPDPARPSILDRPASPAPARAISRGPRLDGRLQLGVDGLRTATDAPGELPEVTRSFATPFAALRLRADDLGGGLRLDINARSSYRWADGATLDRAGDTRVYTLSLSRRLGAVDASAGRFVLAQDPFTGAWDGVALRLGDRSRGVGVAGGLQPDYGAGIPTAEFPKGVLFGHAEGAVGRGVRGRVQALAGAISPSGEGLRLRPFAGVRPQLWGRGFTLSAEALADRVPDSTQAWTLSRLSGRGSLEAAPGFRLHAFALRRRSYLLFGTTQAMLPASTRAGGGASLTMRRGPMPGTTLRADASRAWAADLSSTLSFSSGLHVPRIPGAGLGVSVDATAWTRDETAGTRNGLSAGAALTRSLRGGFVQAGYRYGRSPLGAGEYLTTQGLDATFQMSVTTRVAVTLQASVQAGDVLRSTRVYTALWYRL